MTPNNGDMGKEERKEFILGLLDETDIPLPPAVIFRASKFRGAHFERRTMARYLNELAGEGKIRKLDPGALDDGQQREVDPSDNGYWVITDAGREYLR